MAFSTYPARDPQHQILHEWGQEHEEQRGRDHAADADTADT
jgi:hypothetical protein